MKVQGGRKFWGVWGGLSFGGYGTVSGLGSRLSAADDGLGSVCFGEVGIREPHAPYFLAPLSPKPQTPQQFRNFPCQIEASAVRIAFGLEFGILI